jgi:hypothetical protein
MPATMAAQRAQDARIKTPTVAIRLTAKSIAMTPKKTSPPLKVLC